MPRTSRRRTEPDPRNTHARHPGHPRPEAVSAPSARRNADRADVHVPVSRIPATRSATPRAIPMCTSTRGITIPTVQEAEERLALMMEADRALVFSSGMAAITSTLLAAARSGDEHHQHTRSVRRDLPVLPGPPAASRRRRAIRQARPARRAPANDHLRARAQSTSKRRRTRRSASSTSTSLCGRSGRHPGGNAC